MVDIGVENRNGYRRNYNGDGAWIYANDSQFFAVALFYCIPFAIGCYSLEVDFRHFSFSFSFNLSDSLSFSLAVE